MELAWAIAWWIGIGQLTTAILVLLVFLYVNMREALTQRYSSWPRRLLAAAPGTRRNSSAQNEDDRDR